VEKEQAVQKQNPEAEGEGGEKFHARPGRRQTPRRRGVRAGGSRIAVGFFVSHSVRIAHFREGITTDFREMQNAKFKMQNEHNAASRNQNELNHADGIGRLVVCFSAIIFLFFLPSFTFIHLHWPSLTFIGEGSERGF
jgi:hypothetical protein